MKQTVSVQQTDHDRHKGDNEGGLLGLPSVALLAIALLALAYFVNSI